MNAKVLIGLGLALAIGAGVYFAVKNKVPAEFKSMSHDDLLKRAVVDLGLGKNDRSAIEKLKVKTREELIKIILNK